MHELNSVIKAGFRFYKLLFVLYQRTRSKNWSSEAEENCTMSDCVTTSTHFVFPFLCFFSLSDQQEFKKSDSLLSVSHPTVMPSQTPALIVLYLRAEVRRLVISGRGGVLVVFLSRSPPSVGPSGCCSLLDRQHT